MIRKTPSHHNSPRVTRAMFVLAMLGSMGLSTNGNAWAADGPPPVDPIVAARYADSGWSARRPEKDSVDFRGAVNFDQAGGNTTQILYPAPGLIGLLAAVATHAVIVGATRGSERSKIQIEADNVLAPYRASLATLDHSSLFQRAMEKSADVAWSPTLTAGDAAGGSTWVVESQPVFLMTQDQRAVILENTVAVFAPGAAVSPAYQNVMRVVSRPMPDGDVVAGWNAEQGQRLREVSSELLALSLAMARRAAVGELPAPGTAQKTFRFTEGGRERFERAQLVSRGCDRLVLQNLRGWLMSVPAQADAEGAPATCAGEPKPPVETPASTPAASATDLVVSR